MLIDGAQIAQCPSGAIVNHSDPVALGKKLLDQVRADEPGPTSYQDVRFAGHTLTQSARAWAIASASFCRYSAVPMSRASAGCVKYPPSMRTAGRFWLRRMPMNR